MKKIESFNKKRKDCKEKKLPKRQRATSRAKARNRLEIN